MLTLLEVNALPHPRRELGGVGTLTLKCGAWGRRWSAPARIGQARGISGFLHPDTEITNAMS